MDVEEHAAGKAQPVELVGWLERGGGRMSKVHHTASRIIDATDECLILAKVAPKKRERFCRKVRQLTSDLISQLRANRDVLTAATISNTINDTLETQIGSACHECRKELSDARNELTGG